MNEARVPRACGDEPWDQAFADDAIRRSPRMRG